MRFDIEGFITFDTEEASLVNLLTGDCIELSATSTRLLTSLLQYRGILFRGLIFSRRCLKNMARGHLIVILISTSQRCVAALRI